MLSLYVSTTTDDVTYSDNGGDVLEFLYANKDNADDLPDMIFLDLNMPIMNGWDFLDRFISIQNTITKPIPIYVISSSIDPVDISKSRKYLSVKDYIIKPMTKLALQKIFAAGPAS